MTPARVLVVGAGHHGLVGAIRLAARGHSVTVLEAAPRPGGAVSSGEDTLPGFVHDRCSGFFPMTVASPAFADLPLARHGLEWVQPEVPMAHVLGGSGAIALHRDVEATAASLDACAAGAGSAWRDLMARLWPHRDALVAAGLSRFPAVRRSARLLMGLRGQVIELAPLLVASVAALGHDLFGDDRAAGWLAGSAAHTDLNPQAAGTGAFGLGLNFLGHTVGWPFPRGGAGRLTDALVAHLAELGGAVRCGAPVERIEVRDGRAAGVRLAGGERLDADAVVATLSPAPLLAILPDGAFPGRVTRRLRTWRYGLGTLKLDYALAGPVPWLAADARRAGVVHVGGRLADLAAAQQQAANGRMPDRPTLVVGQQTVHDPSRAPAGEHTLYVYARVPQRPDLPDDELAGRVESRIEELAPGFADLVRDRAIRTPATLERENANLGGGDLAAGSMSLDQQFVFRPDPRLFRYRTPVAGLYVAGGATHPGAGVHGVSGRGAADALLADLRVRRTRRRDRRPA